MKKLLPILLLCALPACDMLKQKEEQPMDDIGLSRHYNMVDRQGNYAGSVILKPVGYGEVLDRHGRLVGRIVSPN